MTEGYEREPVSPLDAPVMGFPSESRGHIMDQWRPSIESTVQQQSIVEREKPAWAPPPLPPIPREKEPEAWRKRSQKRCSLASQLSNYTATEFPSDFENKHVRKISVVSLDPSVKSGASRNFSRPTRWKEDRSRSVDLNWKLAGYNPQNWSTAKKWFHTISAGSVAFCCTLGSSITPISFVVVDERFGSASVIRVLPLALFAAGLAFGPPLNTLLSELAGRKVVSIVSMAAFTLVTLGSAFVTTFYPFLACRVAAAILASPALDASLSIILEVWPTGDRVLALAAYTLLLLYGISMGPVIEPYLVWFKDPRWPQFVTLFAIAPCLVLLVSIRETHRTTQRRRTSSGSTFGRFTSDNVAVLGRPFYLLCTQPRVLLCALVSSFTFATFYSIISVSPELLVDAYKGRGASRALAFLGMVVGVTIGIGLMVAIQSLLRCSKNATLDRKDPTRSEKERATSSHIHMDSRASITPFRHAPSAMSDLPQSRTASRSSLPFLKLETPIQDGDKNMDVAAAVAQYLNDLPSNKGTRIEPERVLSVLEQSLAFDDLCLLLEGYDLTFDRASLAGILADTLPSGTRDADIMKPPAVRTSSPLSTPVADDKIWPLPPDSPTVMTTPQTSRSLRHEPRLRKQHDESNNRYLWTALLGTLLSTGGLFMFGWTIDLKLAWIVTVVAMGIFACGGTVVFVSATEYLMVSSRSNDGEHAVAACSIFRWVLAAAFSIFAVPLFNGMDGAWATSVLGFINAGGVLLVLVLIVLHRATSRSATASTAA